MPTYMVKNKRHWRATVVETSTVDGAGITHTVRNAGNPVVFEVGDLITDLTAAELAAFPDKFELIEEPAPARRRAE